MAILLERNAEQTVSLKGSKLDLSSFRDLRKMDEAADGEKKPSQKEETGKIREDSLTVVREYEGNQGNAIACSDEGHESSSVKGFDELNASMEGHIISDAPMHVYTGYPAYGPYLPPAVPPAETVYYHNPAVDYSYVHMQAPYGCTIPSGVQYIPPSNGYVPVNPYDFYQIPPPFGHYAAPYAGYVSTDQQQVPMMLPDPNNGYALEMAPLTDALISQSGFAPYYPQRSLSASAPVWMNMDVEATKETDGECLSEELKEAAQPEGVEVLTNPCPSSPIQHDSRTKGFSENSKKQQYRRAVMQSGPVLSKKAWPAQLGAWQYVAVSPSPSSLKLVPKSLQGRADSNTVTPPNAKLAVVHEADLSDSSLDLGNAKHFVIKSFSEENVYRSIEHGVWASTPSGNHKLNVVFQDIQHRTQGKLSDNHRCPIFLYFSVNGSGRFCGVAEMVGPVEFKKTMEFWDRNKWCGSFPVKWHIIKDVPNSQLRRIILQNNENKPVTSSRDTQEIVNNKQGLEMLDIFKSYPTKVSILDRFPELPSRQNIVNDDKKEEVSGGDGDHPQASAMEHNLIKRTEEISLNPSKAWNAGLEHTEDSYLLPKRKPLLPAKIANVDNVVVGKEAEKQNMLMVHRVDVKA